MRARWIPAEDGQPLIEDCCVSLHSGETAEGDSGCLESCRRYKV